MHLGGLCNAGPNGLRFVYVCYYDWIGTVEETRSQQVSALFRKMKEAGLLKAALGNYFILAFYTLNLPAKYLLYGWWQILYRGMATFSSDPVCWFCFRMENRWRKRESLVVQILLLPFSGLQPRWTMRDDRFPTPSCLFSCLPHNRIPWGAQFSILQNKKSHIMDVVKWLCKSLSYSYLHISRKGKIFPERMTFKTVICKDSPQIWVVGEEYSKHIPDLEKQKLGKWTAQYVFTDASWLVWFLWFGLWFPKHEILAINC